MTDVDHIWVVDVRTDPDDSLAMFRDRDHAERFRDAMQADGHEAILSEEPLMGGEQAEDMIRSASPPVEQPQYRVHSHEEGWAIVDTATEEVMAVWETEDLARADAVVLNQGAQPEVIA